MGWGQVAQHRASGHKGGLGVTGLMKHHYSTMLKEYPDHYGHPSTHPPHPNITKKWASIRELDRGARAVVSEPLCSARHRGSHWPGSVCRPCRVAQPGGRRGCDGRLRPPLPQNGAKPDEALRGTHRRNRSRLSGGCGQATALCPTRATRRMTTAASGAWPPRRGLIFDRRDDDGLNA